MGAYLGRAYDSAACLVANEGTVMHLLGYAAQAALHAGEKGVAAAVLEDATTVGSTLQQLGNHCAPVSPGRILSVVDN